MPAWDYRLPPRPDAAPGEQPPMSDARLDVRIPEPSGRGRILNVSKFIAMIGRETLIFDAQLCEYVHLRPLSAQVSLRRTISNILRDSPIALRTKPLAH